MNSGIRSGKLLDKSYFNFGWISCLVLVRVEVSYGRKDDTIVPVRGRQNRLRTSGRLLTLDAIAAAELAKYVAGWRTAFAGTSVA